MADKLNEWILDKLSGTCSGSKHVHETVKWIHETQPEDDAGLVDDVQSSKSWNTLIPDTC